VVPQSATLAINERLEARRAAGEPVLNLGFGEAGLPVLPEVVRTLAQAAPRNRYAPVAGSAAARAAAAGYFTRRRMPTGADQIVLAPGSKALLYALIASLPGDVVLPRPSWVSYAAQAALAHKRVIGVPTPEAVGGVPAPGLLRAALGRAAGEGLEPGILLVTLPDNPTGTLAGGPIVEQVCTIADEHGLAIVSDEIYRDLSYEPDEFTSPAQLAPERCFVTTGLSKSMALGGWRIGFARFPVGGLGERARHHVAGVASEVWTSLAEPMNEVAAYVLDEPPEVTAHVAASRRLHERVASAVRDEFLAVGALCRAPRGAFYVYPDLAPLRSALDRLGVSTGAELAEHLLQRHGVGVLAGEAFGDDRAALRFRVATSLLYGGGDEERWTALGSPDPVALPWIGEALARLRASLRGLTG
jgi:aspartate aminotransferase